MAQSFDVAWPHDCSRRAPVMPTLDSTLGFFAMALLLAFAPGPDSLFVLMQSLSQGRRAGLWVTVGLCLGLCGHTAAVAWGLAAVFAASPLAFAGLKAVGAAYLLWLAWQAWRAPVAAWAEAATSTTPARQLVLRGAVMNLTNPKVLLFFLAFLPQFVQPERGAVALQVLWFGLCFLVATMLAFGTVAVLADAIGQRLRHSPSVQQGLNRATAVVLAGLALRLLWPD